MFCTHLLFQTVTVEEIKLLKASNQLNQLLRKMKRSKRHTLVPSAGQNTVNATHI